MHKRQSTDFHRRCYEVLARVPAGRVTTYSEIAKALGSRASRAVGTAMAQNSRLITIPCHRVVRSDGSVGQYALGQDEKSALLTQEGIAISNGKVVDFEQVVYRF